MQTIEPTVSQSIPASTDETSTTQAPTSTTTEATGTKKKGSKTPLLILLVVIVVAAIGMFLMNGNLGGTGGGAPAPAPSTEIASSLATSNGFKFNLQEGWMIQEDGSNVIVTNTDATVAIKLESIKSKFSKINQTTIEGYYALNNTLTETKVEETKIGGKDAYIVNTKSGEIPVQMYYINGGSSLTLGAVIVYQSEDSKEKYIASVTELIGTMSYSDDSLKAISTIEMYSTIFGTYKGVFDYVVVDQTTPTTPETPSTEVEQNQEQPQTTPTDQETQSQTP